MRRTLLALSTALLSASLVLAQGETAGDAQPAQADKIDFQKQIQPILQSTCVKCHGPKKQEGDLRLDLRRHVFHDDKDLWSIVPGDPDFSTVYERITLPADDPDIMPAEGEKLSDAQIAVIRAWIEQGAVWPEAADTVLLEREARRREREVIELPALTPDQKAAEQRALDAVRNSGALAMRIAANTIAVEANFSLLGPKIVDDHLETLRGLEPTLVWLNLARTNVGDAGAAEIARHTRLRRLNLSNTQITDAALEHLAKLEELDYLNLYGTAVTDLGIAHLAKLPRLRKLFLWQTQVTDAAAARLLEQLPGLEIDLGRGAETMLAEAEAAANATPDAEPGPAAKSKPVNATCPVTGKPVDPAVTSEFEGKHVAFCCNQCKAKFDADPAAFRAKLKLD